MGEKPAAGGAGLPEKALAAAVAALDRRRLRLALERMRADGGDVAAIAEMIAARLEALPSERRERRDAAIVALAQTFDGKRWAVAGAAAGEIRRYAASAWRRRDYRLARAPLEYAGNPRKLALFAILQEGGDRAAIGRKQIANVLAKPEVAGAVERVDCDPAEGADRPQHGNRAPVPISNPSAY